MKVLQDSDYSDEDLARAERHIFNEISRCMTESDTTVEMMRRRVALAALAAFRQAKPAGS